MGAVEVFLVVGNFVEEMEAIDNGEIDFVDDFDLEEDESLC